VQDLDGDVRELADARTVCRAAVSHPSAAPATAMFVKLLVIARLRSHVRSSRCGACTRSRPAYCARRPRRCT
jgi:hypothetical protein